MNDPTAPTETSNAAPSAPVEQPRTDEKVITMTEREYNSHMAASRRSGAESASRRIEPVAPPAPLPAQATNAPSMAELMQRQEEFEARYQFDREIGKFNLEPAKNERLYRLSRAEKPADISSWVKNTVEDLGLLATSPFRAPVPVAPASTIHRNVDLASATDFVPWESLSPEQKNDNAFLAQRHKHNLGVTRSKQGAPTPKRK